MPQRQTAVSQNAVTMTDLRTVWYSCISGKWFHWRVP